MATLTEEQKRRIEENKRRALAIRATKLSQSAASQPVVASTFTNKPTTIQNSSAKWPSSELVFTAGSRPPLPVAMSTSNTFKTNQSSFSGKPNTNQNSTDGRTTSQPMSASSSTPPLPIVTNGSSTSKLDQNIPNYKSSTSTNESSKWPSTASASNNKPKLRVTFALRSSDRFNVEMDQFHKNLIEILKNLPGKMYDPKKNCWHFPLTSYQACKKALEDTKECLVNAIPPYVLKVFLHQKSMSTDFKTIDLSRIDETLTTSLYPFQREGVQFGISKNGRCIIADDMGLGKTIQGLGIAHYYYYDWPLLIVCPSSMKYQWEEEVRNYLPKVPVTKIFILSKSKDQIHNPSVLICSYDLMSRCEAQLTSMMFGVIILDESHSIKTLKAQRTKTALKLITQAKRCILLSGTPALSRPVELYPQMKAVDPKMLPLKEYGYRYCDFKETYFGPDYSGSSNMEELKLLLEERFMIRRLKSNVLDQLPAKIRQVVILDKEEVKINAKVRSVFIEKLDDGKLKGNEKRGTLLQYYAETGKMKIHAIKKYICQILETGNKFLVFCHHQAVMDAICDLLEEKETYFIRVDGKVNSEERKSVCDQFQNEEKFKVAVLSISAASTGLTLTAAHLVVFAELFWNPGILTQAEDRVHRIGQQDSVLIQYLIATGTADDYIWPLIKEKLNILNQAGLSKDNFSCERTSVTTSNESNKSVMDFFDDMDEFDADLSQCADEVEEIESKRQKLNDTRS